MYLTAFLSQTGIGNTRPQNRVHFCHIGTPEHEGISMFQVIIATHRFINTETAHKCAHSRSHTVACIRIQIIGTETCFNHLGCRIAFPECPLTRAKHTHSSRSLLFQSRLPLFSHNIKGFIPGYFSKVTVFVKLAVLLTQQRLSQTVFTVHNLGQEVTFNTVKSLVYRCIRITLVCHHMAILSTHQNTTACTAKTTGGLIPANTIISRFGCFGNTNG